MYITFNVVNTTYIMFNTIPISHALFYNRFNKTINHDIRRNFFSTCLLYCHKKPAKTWFKYSVLIARLYHIIRLYRSPEGRSPNRNKSKPDSLSSLISIKVPISWILCTVSKQVSCSRMPSNEPCLIYIVQFVQTLNDRLRKIRSGALVSASIVV